MKRAIIVSGAAIVLSYAVIFTIFPKYSVPTGAMNPTIAPGEYIITNRSKDVRRGSIIAFKYPLQPKTSFVKRVVAMPGETVLIRDKRVFIDGKELSEPYVVHEDDQVYPDQPALPEPYRSRDQFGPFTVPAANYFVLGDNRDMSSDSRYWGTVPHENVRGNVILVVSTRTGFRRPGRHE